MKQLIHITNEIVHRNILNIITTYNHLIGCTSNKMFLFFMILVFSEYCLHIIFTILSTSIPKQVKYISGKTWNYVHSFHNQEVKFIKEKTQIKSKKELFMVTEIKLRHTKNKPTPQP